MIEIMNITDYPFQKHTIVTADAPVTLELRYYPRAKFWTASIKYKNKVVNGLKLSLGTLHMRSQNFPFDLVVVDSSNTGIDPYAADDFNRAQASCNA